MSVGLNWTVMVVVLLTLVVVDKNNQKEYSLVKMDHHRNILVSIGSCDLIALKCGLLFTFTSYIILP